MRKKECGMSCSKIMDLYYEYSGGAGNEEPMPILCQVQIWVHSLFCPVCAKNINRYQNAINLLKKDFFPSSPGFEDSIMARIDSEQADETYSVPGGISTHGWVIAGVVILVSLAASFFGLDFQRLATESGMSFMLPVGITIGIVLTTYGALFIGSHLKELSERFGL
jgi:hypothetical protein